MQHPDLPTNEARLVTPSHLSRSPLGVVGRGLREEVGPRDELRRFHPEGSDVRDQHGL